MSQSVRARQFSNFFIIATLAASVFACSTSASADDVTFDENYQIFLESINETWTIDDLYDTDPADATIYEDMVNAYAIAVEDITDAAVDDYDAYYDAWLIAIEDSITPEPAEGEMTFEDAYNIFLEMNDFYEAFYTDEATPGI